MQIPFRYALAPLCVVLAATVFAAEPEAPKAASGGRFVLVCAMQMQKTRLSVDITRKTVNDARATVTPSSITWKTDIANGGDKKMKRFVVHELDRIEGTYRSWPEGGNPAQAHVFGCDKAPAPRF